MQSTSRVLFSKLRIFLAAQRWSLVLVQHLRGRFGLVCSSPLFLLVSMVGCHQDDLLKRAKALQMKPRAGQGAPPTQTLCFSSVLSTHLRSPTSLLYIPRVKPACILLDQPPVLSAIRQQCRSENGESDGSSTDLPPLSSLTKADDTGSLWPSTVPRLRPLRRYLMRPQASLFHRCDMPNIKIKRIYCLPRGILVYIWMLTVCTEKTAT